jgi:hypothetical protein
MANLTPTASEDQSTAPGNGQDPKVVGTVGMVAAALLILGKLQS